MEFIRKTIDKDEDFLRQVSLPVSFLNDWYKYDIEALKNYCQNHSCHALAAIQIGIPRRIIYLKNTDIRKINDNDRNEMKILINPEILSQTGIIKHWETCESCLDYIGLVARPYEMVIKYIDCSGNTIVERFEGFSAAVLSHELDHLDGILHIDIAEKTKNLPSSKRIKLQQRQPYHVISQTCEYSREKIKTKIKF